MLETIYGGHVTQYDTFFISVKNRLKDYFIAANSVPFLPVEQQASAKQLTEIIDGFINNSLCNTVVKFLEKDRDERNYDMVVNASKTPTGGHLFMMCKYFRIMDHLCFTRAVNDPPYRDITPMTLMPSDQVLETLRMTAQEFDKLSRCNRAEDFGKIPYFKNVSETLLGSMYGDIKELIYNERNDEIKLTLTPQNEDQARAIMGFLEANWEQGPLYFEGNECVMFEDEGFGLPQLDVYMHHKPCGENGEMIYIPYYISVRPSETFEPYGGYINEKDVPQEFKDMVNTESLKKWVGQQKDKTKPNRNVDKGVDY